MKALLPEPLAEVDLEEAYALPAGAGEGGVFVRCNMVASLDGSATFQSRSGRLGGPADRRVFSLLRSLTDVVLVGAGTVRAEHYGPVRLDHQARERRVARGQLPVPPVAVVSGSASLDWSSKLFTAAEGPPIVFTTGEGEAKARGPARGLARLVIAGDRSVEPRLVAEHLYGAGYKKVLLEGGPRLSAEFVKAGLVSELCLTVAPLLVSGAGPRILKGPELASPLHVRLLHLLEEDGTLFYRLAVPGYGPDVAEGPSPWALN